MFVKWEAVVTQYELVRKMYIIVFTAKEKFCSCCLLLILFLQFCDKFYYLLTWIYFARFYYYFIFLMIFNCCIWVLATECCDLLLRLPVTFLLFTSFCCGMANVLSTLKLSFLHSFLFSFLLHFSLLFSLLLFRRYSYRPRKEQNSYSSWARYDMFFVCYFLI